MNKTADKLVALIDHLDIQDKIWFVDAALSKIEASILLTKHPQLKSEYQEWRKELVEEQGRQATLAH